MFFKKENNDNEIVMKDEQVNIDEVSSIASEIDEKEDMDKKLNEVMKKYDRESNLRVWTGLPQQIIRWMLIAFSLYAIAINFVFHFETRFNRATFAGAIVLFVYILFPAKRGVEHKENYIPWYDVILGLGGAFSYYYFAANLEEIINMGIMITTPTMVIGIIGIISTLEACRRAVGIPIVVVSSFFIILGLYLKITTAPSVYSAVRNIVYNLFYTTEGVIGTPMRACSTFIVLFVIFGSFLDKTGISDFFIDFANSLTGSSTGGPAKVAVISSALCGMVSGSSVGNTVTTGSVTIPLMKKTGYPGEFAGAVEAAASTGGQIMPPIMGAAAFLMVEYTGKSYGFIALRACLPALLYFAGIFISVHLEAKKRGLKGLSKDDIPKIWDVIKRSWFLVIPLFLLVWLIIKTTMAYAAIIATICTIIVAVIADFTQGRAKNVEGGYFYHFFIGCFKNYDKSVMSLNKICDGLEAGARSTIAVGIACAAAGIIACIITVTGIGNRLISGIVKLANNQMIIAMILTMITCIILGMGVPTTANYVIMATTCAPILVRMGMNGFASHMFVFYFGIVADITPPVALAAYAGAAIAGAKPMKTAFNATQLAIAAFIVPFVFGLDPRLLFIGLTPGALGVLEVVKIVVTSLIGIFGVAAGLRGYAIRELNIVQRVIMIAAGLMLIHPGTGSDIVGIGVMALIIVWDILKMKKEKVKA